MHRTFFSMVAVLGGVFICVQGAADLWDRRLSGLGIVVLGVLLVLAGIALFRTLDDDHESGQAMAQRGKYIGELRRQYRRLQAEQARGDGVHTPANALAGHKALVEHLEYEHLASPDLASSTGELRTSHDILHSSQTDT